MLSIFVKYPKRNIKILHSFMSYDLFIYLFIYLTLLFTEGKMHLNLSFRFHISASVLLKQYFR